MNRRRTDLLTPRTIVNVDIFRFCFDVMVQQVLSAVIPIVIIYV